MLTFGRVALVYTDVADKKIEHSVLVFRTIFKETFFILFYLGVGAAKNLSMQLSYKLLSSYCFKCCMKE